MKVPILSGVYTDAAGDFRATYEGEGGYLNVGQLVREAYGADWKLWVQRWRMFYMAVAEFFGFDEGREWGVVHYLFEKR